MVGSCHHSEKDYGKKKKIELEVLNISNSQEQAGAYALVLGEVDGAVNYRLSSVRQKHKRC